LNGQINWEKKHKKAQVPNTRKKHKAPENSNKGFKETVSNLLVEKNAGRYRLDGSPKMGTGILGHTKENKGRAPRTKARRETKSWVERHVKKMGTKCKPQKLEKILKTATKGKEATFGRPEKMNASPKKEKRLATKITGFHTKSRKQGPLEGNREGQKTHTARRCDRREKRGNLTVGPTD